MCRFAWLVSRIPVSSPFMERCSGWRKSLQIAVGRCAGEESVKLCSSDEMMLGLWADAVA